MDDRKQKLIEACVVALEETNKKHGYTTISIQTLKEIISVFAKRNGSPNLPTLPPRETLRPKIRVIPKLPTFTCNKCTKVKLVAEAAVVISRSDRIGCCKDCEKMKDNIVLFKKR